MRDPALFRRHRARSSSRRGRCGARQLGGTGPGRVQILVRGGGRFSPPTLYIYDDDDDENNPLARIITRACLRLPTLRTEVYVLPLPVCTVPRRRPYGTVEHLNPCIYTYIHIGAVILVRHGKSVTLCTAETVTNSHAGLTWFRDLCTRGLRFREKNRFREAWCSREAVRFLLSVSKIPSTESRSKNRNRDYPCLRGAARLETFIFSHASIGRGSEL